MTYLRKIKEFCKTNHSWQDFNGDTDGMVFYMNLCWSTYVKEEDVLSFLKRNHRGQLVFLIERKDDELST